MSISVEDKAKLRVLKYKLLEKSEHAQRITGQTYDLLLELGGILKVHEDLTVLYPVDSHGEQIKFYDKEKGWEFVLIITQIGFRAHHVYDKNDPLIEYSVSIYPLEMLPTAAKKDFLKKYPRILKGFINSINARKYEKDKDLLEMLEYLVDPTRRI